MKLYLPNGRQGSTPAVWTLASYHPLLVRAFAASPRAAERSLLLPSVELFESLLRFVLTHNYVVFPLDATTFSDVIGTFGGPESEEAAGGDFLRHAGFCPGGYAFAVIQLECCVGQWPWRWPSCVPVP
jgi:hypothetical protein